MSVNKNPLGGMGPSYTLDGSCTHPHPEVVMIFSTSLPRFKAFLGDCSCKSTDWACCLLLISSFLLPRCRRSVAAAARSLLHDVHDAGWLLRWLGSSAAPAALLAAAQVQLLHAARAQADRLHLVASDSTMHGQQGQNTQNTYACRNTQKRPTKSDRHQKKFHRRSEHGFVFALLLTPQGLRIPYWLPFYTQQYGALFGRTHNTQADLAGQLMDSIALDPGTPVVVVGDTALEAKQVRQACARRDWNWVVPLNPERRLEGGVGIAAAVVAKDVGSGRGAVSAFRLVRFPDLPTEPGVRVSTHRALHGHAGGHRAISPSRRSSDRDGSRSAT